eukprot:tig00000681_g3146.t1
MAKRKAPEVIVITDSDDDGGEGPSVGRQRRPRADPEPPLALLEDSEEEDDYYDNAAAASDRSRAGIRYFERIYRRAAAPLGKYLFRVWRVKHKRTVRGVLEYVLTKIAGIGRRDADRQRARPQSAEGRGGRFSKRAVAASSSHLGGSSLMVLGLPHKAALPPLVDGITTVGDIASWADRIEAGIPGGRAGLQRIVEQEAPYEWAIAYYRKGALLYITLFSKQAEDGGPDDPPRLYMDANSARKRFRKQLDHLLDEASSLTPGSVPHDAKRPMAEYRAILDKGWAAMEELRWFGGGRACALGFRMAPPNGQMTGDEVALAQETNLVGLFFAAWGDFDPHLNPGAAAALEAEAARRRPGRKKKRTHEEAESASEPALQPDPRTLVPRAIGPGELVFLAAGAALAGASEAAAPRASGGSCGSSPRAAARSTSSRPPRRWARARPSTRPARGRRGGARPRAPDLRAVRARPPPPPLPLAALPPLPAAVAAAPAGAAAGPPPPFLLCAAAGCPFRVHWASNGLCALFRAHPGHRGTARCGVCRKETWDQHADPERAFSGCKQCSELGAASSVDSLGRRQSGSSQRLPGLVLAFPVLDRVPRCQGGGGPRCERAAYPTLATCAAHARPGEAVRCALLGCGELTTPAKIVCDLCRHSKIKQSKRWTTEQVSGEGSRGSASFHAPGRARARLRAR